MRQSVSRPKVYLFGYTVAVHRDGLLTLQCFHNCASELQDTAYCPAFARVSGTFANQVNKRAARIGWGGAAGSDETRASLIYQGDRPFLQRNKEMAFISDRNWQFLIRDIERKNKLPPQALVRGPFQSPAPRNQYSLREKRHITDVDSKNMFRQDLLLTWPSGIGIRKVKITNNNNNYISVSDSSSRTVKLRLSGTDAIDILYNVHDSKLLQFWRLAREHLLVLPEPVYPFAGVTYKR